MKLASLTDGRDGRLVVVSNDLTRCASAADVAATMQAALDDWANARPALEVIAEKLEAGGGDDFDQTACASPLRVLLRSKALRETRRRGSPKTNGSR